MGGLLSRSQKHPGIVSGEYWEGRQMKELWVKQRAGWNQHGLCHARRANGPTEEAKAEQPQSESPVDCEYWLEGKRRWQ